MAATSHYFRSDNINPGNGSLGNAFGLAGNNITNRGADVLENLRSQRPSKNMAEASLKTLKLYKRCCRMVVEIPIILRFHEIQWKVNPIQAKLNLIASFRAKGHFRDPAQIDFWVTKGYERLVEAELHHTYSTYLFQYLCPKGDHHYDKAHNDRGYSYFDEKKYKGKTGFLKGFYKGNKTNY